MAINKRFPGRLFFAALFLFWLASFAGAQSAGYFLDTDGDAPRFIQRLAWTPDEYALRYAVEIEKEDGALLLREFTEKPYVEVSLSPGKYRYRVIPYDLLNHPSGEPEWTDLEVLAALNPEIDAFSPALIYREKAAAESRNVVNISGKNLSPGATVYLRGEDGREVSPREFSVVSDGESAALTFEDSQLEPGNYDIFIRNPGGLQTSKGPIAVAYSEPPPEPELEPEPEPELEPEPPPKAPAAPRKPIEPGDAFISVNWMPLWPVYGDFLGEGASFAGAAFRFGAFAFKNDIVSAGLEHELFFNVSNSGVSASPLGIPVIAYNLNLFARKWFFKETMGLTFRAGAGFIARTGGGEATADTVFAGSGANDSALTVLSRYFSQKADFGVSFIWLFSRYFFVETGLDYTHLFQESASGGFRPWIGLGSHF